MKTTEDTKPYVLCMTKIKQRIAVVRWLKTEDPLGATKSMLTAELVFVQFRKILELIAFSTLTANKEKYSKTHKNYGDHWNAKQMLACVERENVDFYPVPVAQIKTDVKGRGMLPKRRGGYLTRKDFEMLLDAAGQVLHMRNPFSTKDPLATIHYTELEYAEPDPESVIAARHSDG